MGTFCTNSFNYFVYSAYILSISFNWSNLFISFQSSLSVQCTWSDKFFMIPSHYVRIISVTRAFSTGLFFAPRTFFLISSFATVYVPLVCACLSTQGTNSSYTNYYVLMKYTRFGGLSALISLSGVYLQKSSYKDICFFMVTTSSSFDLIFISISLIFFSIANSIPSTINKYLIQTSKQCAYMLIYLLAQHNNNPFIIVCIKLIYIYSSISDFDIDNNNYYS